MVGGLGSGEIEQQNARNVLQIGAKISTPSADGCNETLCVSARPALAKAGLIMHLESVA
jgi:hypothetical protein